MENSPEVTNSAEEESNLPSVEFKDFSGLPAAQPNHEVEPNFSLDSGLTFKTVGICKTDGQGREVEFTNFELRLAKVYVEHNEILNEDRRTTSDFQVFQEARKIGHILVEERGWKSRAEFLNSIQGLGNLFFTGTDQDLQRMKSAVLSNTKGAETVKKVASFGIHHDTLAGNDVFTYVEPGWSVNNFSQINTHSLLGNRPVSAPKLEHVPTIEYAQEGVHDLLMAFASMNEPLPNAQILGWLFACFVKRHIETWRKEFPLINVYGNAGSGKTQGLLKFCQIFGVDYDRSADATTATNVTDFALWKNLSDRETSPLILDEFNLSKLGKKRYIKIGEWLKDAYQRGAVERGAISKGTEAGSSPFGADIMRFPLAAPVAVCSEQGMVDFPALVSRTVQIPIKPAGLAWNDNTPRKSFALLGKNRDLIKQLSKYLYLYFINTPVSNVLDQYKKNTELVPTELGDRPHHSYTTVLTGLDFFREITASLGVNMDDKYLELRRSILRMFVDSIGDMINTKMRSEIDIVIDTWATMAASVHDADLSRDSLKPGIHYRVSGGTVWIDVTMTFSAYKRYSSMVDRSPPVIALPSTFRELVKNEPYFEEERSFEDFGRGQPCIGLNIDTMRNKGIAANSFINEEIQ